MDNHSDINNFKRPVKLGFDLIDAKNNKKVLSKVKIKFVIAKNPEEKNLKEIFITNEELIGKYTAKDLLDKNSNIILSSGSDIKEEEIEKIKNENIKSLELVI